MKTLAAYDEWLIRPDYLPAYSQCAHVSHRSRPRLPGYESFPRHFCPVSAVPHTVDDRANAYGFVPFLDLVEAEHVLPLRLRNRGPPLLSLLTLLNFALATIATTNLKFIEIRKCITSMYFAGLYTFAIL